MSFCLKCQRETNGPEFRCSNGHQLCKKCFLEHMIKSVGNQRNKCYLECRGGYYNREQVENFRISQSAFSPTSATPSRPTLSVQSTTMDTTTPTRMASSIVSTRIVTVIESVDGSERERSNLDFFPPGRERERGREIGADEHGETEGAGDRYGRERGRSNFSHSPDHFPFISRWTTRVLSPSPPLHPPPLHPPPLHSPPLHPTGFATNPSSRPFPVRDISPPPSPYSFGPARGLRNGPYLGGHHHPRLADAYAFWSNREHMPATPSPIMGFSTAEFEQMPRRRYYVGGSRSLSGSVEAGTGVGASEDDEGVSEEENEKKKEKKEKMEKGKEKEQEKEKEKKEEKEEKKRSSDDADEKVSETITPTPDPTLFPSLLSVFSSSSSAPPSVNTDTIFIRSLFSTESPLPAALPSASSLLPNPSPTSLSSSPNSMVSSNASPLTVPELPPFPLPVLASASVSATASIPVPSPTSAPAPNSVSVSATKMTGHRKTMRVKVEEKRERDICVICQCFFDDGETIIATPCHPFSHYYHPECLQEWLKSHRNCPVCKFYFPRK